MGEVEKKENKRRKKKEKITQSLKICIGPTIRIGLESCCLPYAGFLGGKLEFWIYGERFFNKR